MPWGEGQPMSGRLLAVLVSRVWVRAEWLGRVGGCRCDMV